MNASVASLPMKEEVVVADSVEVRDTRTKAQKAFEESLLKRVFVFAFS